MRIIFLILMFVSCGTAFAAESIQISVKGMVCGFCTQGIKKKFSKEPGVEKVDVSLENGTVTLFLKEGENSLSDKRIDDVLADAGFSAEKIKR